jgi:hypothetical protein
LGELAIQQGASTRGVRLVGAACALDKLFLSSLDSDDRVQYDASLASARDALGEERVAEALREGEAMSMEQAIEYAMNDELVIPGLPGSPAGG